MYLNQTVTASFVHLPPAPEPLPPVAPKPPLPLPDTRIVAAKIEKPKGKATFRFEGTDETRSFQCKLIRPAVNGHQAKAKFAACKKKTVFKHVAPGRYTLQVRALNATGSDPTPAKRRFTV
jgi:hypothetical protein